MRRVEVLGLCTSASGVVVRHELDFINNNATLVVPCFVVEF
jgi:hypothetical protein